MFPVLNSEVQHAPLPNTPRGDEDASEVWSLLPVLAAENRLLDIARGMNHQGNTWRNRGNRMKSIGMVVLLNKN